MKGGTRSGFKNDFEVLNYLSKPEVLEAIGAKGVEVKNFKVVKPKLGGSQSQLGRLKLTDGRKFFVKQTTEFSEVKDQELADENIKSTLGPRTELSPFVLMIHGGKLGAKNGIIVYPNIDGYVFGDKIPIDTAKWPKWIHENLNDFREIGSALSRFHVDSMKNKGELEYFYNSGCNLEEKNILVHPDFQASNILITKNRVHFVDTSGIKVNKQMPYKNIFEAWNEIAINSPLAYRAFLEGYLSNYEINKQNEILNVIKRKLVEEYQLVLPTEAFPSTFVESEIQKIERKVTGEEVRSKKAEIGLETAIAGAYRNNCSFHCIAHTLLSLDEGKIKELFKEYPIYNQIMKAFFDYYELDDNYDLNHFIATVNKFNHPMDKEILFGQVLRKVLRDQVMGDSKSTKEDIKDVQELKLVSDDLVGKLANQMGASLIIHPQGAPPDIYVSYPKENSSWNIDIYHIGKPEDGHYNFSFPDEQKNAIHNAQYTKDHDSNRLVPKSTSDSLLFDKSNIVGERDQKKAIKQVVQLEYEATLLEQKPAMVEDQAGHNEEDRKKEEEVRRKEEEARQRKEQEEIRRKAEQEVKQRKEEEARIKKEEEARRKEEAMRKEEETRLKVQEELRRKEEVRKRKEEETRQRKAQEELKRKEQEVAKRRQEEVKRVLLERIKEKVAQQPEQDIKPKKAVEELKDKADKKTQYGEMPLEPKKEAPQMSNKKEIDELMKLLSNINVEEKYRNANVKKKFSFAHHRIFQHHDRKAQIRHLKDAISSAIALLKQDMTRNAFEVLETTIENIAQDLNREREKGRRKLGDSRMEKVIMDLHSKVENIKSHMPTPPKNKL